LQLDQRGRAIRGLLAEYIENTIARDKPDLVSIDPYVKAVGCDENSNTLMDMCAQILTDMCHKFDVAIDIPQHQRKGPAQPGDADRGRGASSTRDAGRLVYTLTRMSSEEASNFSILEADRRNYLRMDQAKVNLLPAMKAKWFKLSSVSIGNATADYPAGDAIQVVGAWTPPGTWEGLDVATCNRILDEIHAGLPGQIPFSDAPNAKARAVWPIVQKHAPGKNEAQCKDVIKQWVREGVLVRKDYYDPKQGAARQPQGLAANAAKRPKAERTDE
jgi:hypothetical protein